jgi:hypothetical protein
VAHTTTVLSGANSKTGPTPTDNNHLYPPQSLPPVYKIKEWYDEWWKFDPMAPQDSLDGALELESLDEASSSSDHSQHCDAYSLTMSMDEAGSCILTDFDTGKWEKVRGAYPYVEKQ